MPDSYLTPSGSLVQLERAGSESVVHLHGEVDLYNAADLRCCLEELAASGATRVVLDLANLGFIDSSGLGALIGGMRRLRRAGGQVVLRSPNAKTAELLEMTGLDQVLAVET